MDLSQIQSKVAAVGTMDSGTSSSLSIAPARSGAMFCQTILWLADRLRKPLFVAIAAAYLLGFNGQWRMGPDSGLYLNLARSLASGNGYTYHGIRQETVYPGFPLALAAEQIVRRLPADWQAVSRVEKQQPPQAGVAQISSGHFLVGPDEVMALLG